jgi:hypothetical protein
MTKVTTEGKMDKERNTHTHIITCEEAKWDRKNLRSDYFKTQNAFRTDQCYVATKLTVVQLFSTPVTDIGP